MAKILLVGPEVNFRDVFAIVNKINLQSAVAIPKIGTMLVVDPSQEEAAITLLKTEFVDAVSVLEAELHVPTDWGVPGFVDATLQEKPDARIVMTSGLGLLVADN